MKRTLKPPHVVSSANRKITIFLMVIFVLVSFWGADWFHYLEGFPILKNGGNTHMEDVYILIAQNLSPNYLFFRAVVWGSSLFLFLHLLKRLSVSTNLAIFVFCSIYIIWFSYARATLAMILVYYGLSLFYKPYKNKVFSYIMAVLAIGCSFFFHKTALFAIAVSILVILSNKNERKIMTILLILYPLLVFLSSNYLTDFLSMDIEGDENMMGKNLSSGQNYLEAEQSIRGIGGLLLSFLEQCPYFILAYISFMYVRSKSYASCPNDIKAFVRLFFYTVFISSIFAFDLGANTRTIFVRFLRFAAMPAVVVLSYFISTRFCPRLTKVTYKIAFLGTLYATLYSLYISFLGNGLF